MPVLPLLASVALAEPPPAREMYQNGMAVAAVGAVVTPLSVVALNLDGLEVVGFVGGIAGPPMLAGGSWRASTGLRQLRRRAPPIGSTICWVGWLGANLWSLADPYGLGPVAAFGASYLGGVGQMAANASTWQRWQHGTDARGSAAPSGRSGPRMVVGFSTQRGRPGLVVSGTL